MIAETLNITTLETAAAGGAQSVLSATALQELSERFRPTGAAVALATPDGRIAWQNRQATAFFTRYAIPLLAWAAESEPLAVAGLGLRWPPDALDAGDAPFVWEAAPGVHVAALPLIEKRVTQAVLLLVARTPQFSLDEDVLRNCGRLGLDAHWLAQQADQLPGYGVEALRRHAELLQGCVRDQLRGARLEQELNNVSEQLANTYEELSLIYQISGGMRVNRRADEFFKQACLDVLEVMNVRGMGVCLRGDLPDLPEPAVYGRLTLPSSKVRRISDELMSILAERKSPLLLDRLATDKTFFWLDPYCRQLMAVPLQRGDEVLGCLFALDKEAGDFDSVDTKLLNSIANESAIYLENAMLFEDVHGLMMGLLHSLTSAVDAKDAYTCGHSERVALISRHLAQQAGLPDGEVERIYMAGLLHDVGKIGVPEAVLQKTGKLTPEEFELMKKHPQIGARILSDVKQLKHIIPGVLHHHERYDGKGYPAGLAGERIPLMGRIICLADCFDAMTSNRTYRRALPLEVAMGEIRRCAGTQFDPRLAAAFLRTGPEGYRELLRNHQEKSKRLLELQETLRSK